MICDMCGKRGARVRRTVRTFGTGRSTFLVEGVPLVRCPNCGESYFTAETLFMPTPSCLALDPA